MLAAIVLPSGCFPAWAVSCETWIVLLWWQNLRSYNGSSTVCAERNFDRPGFIYSAAQNKTIHGRNRRLMNDFDSCVYNAIVSRLIAYCVFIMDHRNRPDSNRLSIIIDHRPTTSAGTILCCKCWIITHHTKSRKVCWEFRWSFNILLRNLNFVGHQKFQIRHCVNRIKHLLFKLRICTVV